MTEPGLLPQFIREALEAGADEIAEHAVPGQMAAEEMAAGQTGASTPSEPATLSTLLSLESALGAATAPAAGAPPGLLARLEATLNEAPHRYAPFYAKAAELFDLPESDVIAVLARLKDPAVWSFAGLPGIAKVKVAGGPAVAQAETLLVRFNPGVRFPEHEHVGLERVLVLEGSYTDSNGVLHRAGELRDFPCNTSHSFRVGPEPCIFASVVFARRFRAWPLRALARILGS